jgi:uncharacterized membrane protein YphA (DoxX/SURF4 family)
MFPTGIAGVALFVLRCSVAINLIVDGTANGVLVKPVWLLLGLAVPASLLCLGLMTPYCAAFGCLIQLGALFAVAGNSKFHLVLSILNIGVVAILGPGAYSVDARIFGRRLLVVPPRR